MQMQIVDMKVTKNLIGILLWQVAIPIATVLGGPLRSRFYKNYAAAKLNVIWDPFYSFGFSFVINEDKGNFFANTSQTGGTAFIYMIFAFIFIVYLGGKIRKSAMANSIKTLIFLCLIGTLFLNINIWQASRLHHLYFFSIATN